MFSSSTFGKYARKWLIGIGALELGLAILFVGLSTIDPIVSEGFLATSAILGVTGLVLIGIGLRVGRSADRTDRILTQGIAGSASITALRQTGMYLNEQPQIEMDLLVSLPDRPPYAAKRKEFVPLLFLGRLTSGVPLAVRVDPADPAAVIIDWQTGGVIAPNPMAAMPGGGFVAGGGTGFVAGGGSMPVGVSSPGSPGSGVDESLGQVQAALAASGMPAAAPYSQPGQAGVTIEQLRAHLRANGVPATARIDKLADTGQVVGDERLFTMQVTLEAPGQPPRLLQPSAAMVPLSVAHKVQLGMSVPVKFAAENPDLLMFEWDRL